LRTLVVSPGGGIVRPATGLFSFGISALVNALFGGLSRWVEAGASALVTAFGHALTATTRVPFGPGFLAEFDLIAKIGALFAGPFLLLAVIHAIVRQDLSILLRAVFIRLPLALVFDGIAIALVAQALAITDSLSAALLHLAGGSAQAEVDFLATAFAGGAGGFPYASFLGFLLALMAAVVAFVLWVELVIRSAAIAVATLFVPIALAGLVWSATSHWARRVGETLAALVISKLVIAGVLALAAISLSPGSGVSGTIQAIALLLLACLAPFSLLRLVPMVEAGAIAHFDGMSRRAHRGANEAAAAAAGLFGGAEESVTSLSHDSIPMARGINVSDPALDADAAAIQARFERAPNERTGQADAAVSGGDPELTDE
jgi:hypothetical protein